MMADSEVRGRSMSPSPAVPITNGGSPAKADRSPARSPKRSRSPSPRKRSPSRSRSPRRRSRSPVRKSSRSPRRSRRSRSPPQAAKARKSRSRSPSPCKVLGVFGLHPNTNARDIKDVFIKYGDIDHVDLITDHQTGRSKCFGFVYYMSVNDAAKAKEGLAGLTMDGKTLRIDFSYTRKAHEPTPGKYLGKAPRRRSGGRDGDRYSRRDDYSDRYDRYERDRYERYDRHDRYDRYGGDSRGSRYERDNRYERDSRYDRRSPPHYD